MFEAQAPSFDVERAHSPCVLTASGPVRNPLAQALAFVREHVSARSPKATLLALLRPSSAAITGSCGRTRRVTIYAILEGVTESEQVLVAGSSMARSPWFTGGSGLRWSGSPRASRPSSLLKFESSTRRRVATQSSRFRTRRGCLRTLLSNPGQSANKTRLPHSVNGCPHRRQIDWREHAIGRQGWRLCYSDSL